MSISRQVTCPLTGQSFTLNKDYFTKKVEEYGSESNLMKYYVSSKAKKLINRGYSVDEIRKILNVTEPNLPEASSLSLREVITFHDGGKSASINRRLESTLNFAMQTSDEDVVKFINNIISHEN